VIKHGLGSYADCDSRFTTRAKDKASHNGYERWHRELDADVVKWIERNTEATPQQFENFLKQLYNTPDLITRFPNGL